MTISKFFSQSVFLILSLAGATALSCPTKQPTSATKMVPCLSEMEASTRTLVLQAVDVTSSQSEPAIQKLRAMGPSGLQLVLAEYERLIEPTPELASRYRLVIDRVAKQKYASVSRLYWYTDLNDASRVAKAQKKPVLSLRLLGDLADELSCANSRFFRAALYSNKEISSFLKDHFILHWSSERPAATMTIDYGDGRVVKRTITGNSIHYVLDSSGTPIDALPGLYGPQKFKQALTQSLKLHAQLLASPPSTHNDRIQTYHKNQLKELAKAWSNELKEIAVPDEIANNSPLPVSRTQVLTGAARAWFAQQQTAAKAAAEMPSMRVLAPRGARAALPDDSERWIDIAQRHIHESRLDDASKTLIRSQNLRQWTDESLEVAKVSEEQFETRIERFERSMAEDTIRNEYALRPSIHTWFTKQQSFSFSTLNEHVYTSIFAMPNSDRWLGIGPTNAYTGLENDGLAVLPKP